VTEATFTDEVVAEALDRRGVQQVLHFTTNHGLLGIVASKAIKPRASLEEDTYLEHLFVPNAAFRRDPAWAGHVSLSVSRINTEFFRISQGWHAADDLWWCVISIDASVLTHTGVVFCTVNNIWPSAFRGSGAQGLEAMFSDLVIGRYGEQVTRGHQMPAAWPTSVQAEVLYPGEIPTSYVRRVYVVDRLHGAAGEAQVAAMNHPELQFVVDGAVFEQGVPEHDA